MNRVDEVGRPLLSLNCHNRIDSVRSSRVVFLRSHSCAIDGRGRTLGCSNCKSRVGVLLFTAAAPPGYEALYVETVWSSQSIFFFIVSSDALLCSAGWSTAETHKKEKILTTQNTKAEDFQTWTDFKNVEDIGSDTTRLVVPRSRLATKGGRAFAIYAPRLWNNLPKDIKSTSTLTNFKPLLETYFISPFVFLD